MSRINFGPTTDGTIDTIKGYLGLSDNGQGDDLEVALLEGDLVVLDANEQPVMRWDATAAEWQLEGQDIAGVGSIATEVATINGIPVKRLERYQQNGDESQVSISFTGLDDDVRYFLVFGPSGESGVLAQEAGTIDIHFNGDDAVDNQNYGYWDETGTKQSGEDELELIDLDSLARIGGTVAIGAPGHARAGVDNQLILPNPARINGYLQKGGWDEGETFAEINLTFNCGLTDGNTIDLWEGIQ